MDSVVSGDWGEGGGNRKIPKLFFQTWEHKHFTDLFRSVCLDSWKRYNPEYQFFMYDKGERESFIREHFEERVYLAYCAIGPGAFKADLWRYCVLYKYGGVYADIDTECRGRIDDFVTDDMDFVIPIDLNLNPLEGDYNLAIGFMAASPGCKVLYQVIYRIVENVEKQLVTSRKLDFTGPGALGKEMNLFLGLPETSSFVGKEGVVVTPYGWVVSFLKFEPGTEFVRSVTGPSDQILFQNKNGNADLVFLYEQEIRNLRDYICWY